MPAPITTRADIAATKRKPRPHHVAALKRADEIQKVVDTYHHDPSGNARHLIRLGVPRKEVVQIHRQALGAQTTRADISATQKPVHVLTPRERIAAPNSRNAADAAKDWLGQPMHAKPTRLDRLAKNVVDYGTGIPTLINLAKRGHNSVDLQQTANVKDATSLVGGLAIGGLRGKFGPVRAKTRPVPDNPNVEYRGHHQAPDSEGGAPMHDVTNIYPEDVYSTAGARLYGHPTPEFVAHNRRAVALLKSVRSKPDAEVTVYRAVPHGVDKIHPGDWVTPTRDYAELHGDSNVGNGWHIIERKVRAGDLYTEGNSLHEWGWHPKAAEHGVADGGRIAGAKAAKQIKFPDEMPQHVRSAAGRLASQLDKDSVKKLRAEQERLHSLERKKRAGVAHAALLKHAGSEKALPIALSKLGGEYPKVPVSKVLGEMSGRDMRAIRHYIHTNTRIPFFQKINVQQALEKGLSGRPLTDGERVLLHDAFGKEFATRVEMPSLGTKAKRAAGELANLPRSVESSIDVSATLRQNLVAAARHPGIAAKNFGPGLKSFGSNKYARARLDAIKERPNYRNGFYQRGKVALTDVGDTPGPHEELFPSRLGDKIPGVRQSGRAYTDTTVNNRVDIFDKHIDRARKAGVEVDDRHFLESLGRVVNSMTGRGDLGGAAGVGKVLNAALFSPRLLKSRLDFLNPVYYAKLHPYARREAARAALQTIAGGVFVLELANKAGAGVELDPRSTDFGKMRFGDTRIDIWGGFQPLVRTIAQVATGERKTTTTGDIVKLDGKFGHSTRLDTLFNFVSGKAAPVPSIGLDLLRGHTFVGQPVTLKGEAWQRGVPFGVQDAVDVGRSKGSVLKGVGAFGVSAVGVGVQSYSNDPTKVAKQKHAKLTADLTEEVRRYFHRDLTPELRKALKLRETRLAYLAKAKAKGGTFTPLDTFNAHVDLLLKLRKITPAKARRARAWAAGEHGRVGEHKLASETSKVVRKYFGGAALEDAGRKLRAKGSQFYLGDH